METSAPRINLGLKFTPAIKWLILINTLIYIAYLVIAYWVLPDRGSAQSRIHVDFVISYLALTPYNFIHGDVWQILTFLFLHSRNPLHLLVNMLVLWMFGGLLEARWGFKKFLVFYFICGLGSGIFIILSGLIFPKQLYIPTIGASGAVMGLIVAYGVMLPNQRIYFFGLFPLKGKHIVLLTIGIDFLYFLAQSHISFAAHLGGMTTSFFLTTGYWNPFKIYGDGVLFLLKRKQRSLKAKLGEDTSTQNDVEPFH